MSDLNSTARRYHWHSNDLDSVISDPHRAIYGQNYRQILNMAAKDAATTRDKIMEISLGQPDVMLSEIKKLTMLAYHDIKTKDVDLKRLGAVLWLAHETRPSDFEDLLLLEGLGPRTLQSLTLISMPTQFKDPARFSFAHGGKDGHPIPVPTKVYDETIDIMQTAIYRVKLGLSDKNEAIKRLHQIAKKAEQSFTSNANFEAVIEKEKMKRGNMMAIPFSVKLNHQKKAS